MEEVAPIVLKLPEYLATHDASSLSDPRKSPFSWANDSEGSSVFEILAKDPARLTKFLEGMTTTEAQRRITGLFPLAKLVERFNNRLPHNRFIIDVAGGKGQGLIALRVELGASGVDVPCQSCYRLD